MVYTNKAYKAYDVKYIESFNIEHFKAIQKGYDIERQLLRITTVRLLVLYVVKTTPYTIHHTPYSLQLTACKGYETT
jgi:hypothetical protein